MSERVAAVVLAAGASTRLGRAKQLVRLEGETLLARAAAAAAGAGCDPVIIVLGAEAERMQAEAGLPALYTLVVNGQWREGMASSVQAGLDAVPMDAKGVLLLTCDQPAVTAMHLRALVEAAEGEPIGSGYAGRTGVPAYFPAHRFAALRELKGDAGARGLLAEARVLPLERGELDVDTPAALEALLIAWPQGS